jgi:hypothetical protein
MAIGTFAELKTALSDWSDQGTSLDSYLEDFITLTTDMFNFGSEAIRALRTRDMVAVTSLTPSSGACTLPTDYLEYRRVVEEASIRRELKHIAPSVPEQLYPDRAAGLANDFTIIGGSLYMFPVSSNDIELTYYQKIPALSVSNTTNWLLTKHPGLYLHGGLMQVGIFRNDDALVQRSAALITSLMAGMRRSGEMAEYARASTRLRIAP